MADKYVDKVHATIERVRANQSRIDAMFSDWGKGEGGAVARLVASRELMFEKYIHTCECSDEGGWFAFFQPDGVYDEEMFGYRSTGYATEEEAIAALIRAACADIRKAEVG